MQSKTEKRLAALERNIEYFKNHRLGKKSVKENRRAFNNIVKTFEVMTDTPLLPGQYDRYQKLVTYFNEILKKEVGNESS